MFEDNRDNNLSARRRDRGPLSQPSMQSQHLDREDRRRERRAFAESFKEKARKSGIAQWDKYPSASSQMSIMLSNLLLPSPFFWPNR